MKNENKTMIPDISGVEIFTPEEVEKIMAAVQPFDIYHICIMLSLLMGVTYSELVGVQWGDIDAENKLLRIRRIGITHLIDRGYDISECITTKLKNERQARELMIPNQIANQLAIMKVYHKDDQLILEEPFEEIRAARLQGRYKRFLKKVGVRFKSMSTLRNTFAVRCIEDGMDIEELSKLLGHADAKETSRKFKRIATKTINAV